MKSLRYSVLAIIAACPLAGAAVTLNQIETFSGTHGWTSGGSNPSPPVVAADSGPLGAGDSALLIVSSGTGGAGGRLVAFNQSVWTGNYTAAGIVALTASIRNGGNTDLTIRLAINGPGGWFATSSTPVAALSAWSDVLFDIRPASLTSTTGFNAAATMASVSEVRILHSSAANHIGDPMAASLFVDNIKAVPEPGSAAIAGLAGVFLLGRRRRGARR